jgi:hypothetical protein
VNRADLQYLANERIRDAKALLAAKRWSGAYYVAGYAVECALKACVLAYVEKTGIIFVDRKYAEKCWTHNFADLVRLADLEVFRGNDMAADPDLAENWLVVKDWSELSRYQRKTKDQAERLYQAIIDRSHGVLPWIKNYW